MTTESTYKAAKTVAHKIEKIFSEHLTIARKKGQYDNATIPSAEIIEAIIDTAFWASLRREEGNSPRVSLAYLSPEQADQPILFADKLLLTPNQLTKIAPAFERPGIHLGVWSENGELYIWGATLNIPHYCFVLDVSEPAQVVIKHRRQEGFGKFSNIAVLNGDEIKIVDDRNKTINDCPFMLKTLLDFTSPAIWNNSVNVLLQLAVSMRAHKKGGIILVVPTGSTAWKGSIRQPFHYGVAPAFGGLAKLMQQEKTMKDDSAWQRALSREVEIIAGVSAIDGAVVINDQYELLAFGEKIKRPENGKSVDEIFITEPVIDGKTIVTNPNHTGGTRHLSAAQFIYDQRDAIALVASQDGQFTVFTWSNKKNMVQAHRIDSLLL